MTETRSRRTSTVVALGLAQTLAWGSTYYLPAVLGGAMARGIGVSTPVVYGAFSTGLVVSALLGPWAGRAIDRYGGRGILALSSFVFAAGLAVLGTAQGAIWLCVGWLVLGAGMALGLYDAAFATLAGLYGKAARGPITGITLIAGFASTIAWPVSALLEAEFGWREACLTWAAIHLVIGLPLYLFLIPQPGTVNDTVPVPATEPASDIAPEAGRRTMILLAFMLAATGFVSSAMSAHLPALLQGVGLTTAAAIAAAALVGPAQVAGRIAEFGLLRRFHPLLSARLATLTHPLGAVLLLVMGGPGAAAFAVLYGAGNGVLTIAKGTLPLTLLGPAGYGQRQGLLGAPARLVQAASPFLFGLVLSTHGVTVALAVSSGVSLSALVALLLLRITTTAQDVQPPL